MFGKYTWLFVVLLVTGCAVNTGANDNSSRLENAAKLAFVSYSNCMKQSASLYSSSDASAEEIANAAQSKCGYEFYQYQSAVEEYFSSTVSQSSLGIAQARARIHTDESREKLKSLVIQLVVESRLE